MNKIKIVVKQKYCSFGTPRNLYLIKSLRGAVRVGVGEVSKIVGDCLTEYQVAALCQDTTTYVVEVTS
jgi:hypothetical protein